MSEISSQSQPLTNAGHKVSVAAIPASEGDDPDASQVARLFAQVQQLSVQLEQRNRQLTALYEIGQTLAATLDIRQIYRVMFREIAQKMLGTLHLFERFFRGAVSRQMGVPGTGLGLAICKEIVEQMGGRITVESKPGQGAAFTVWLRSAN